RGVCLRWLVLLSGCFRKMKITKNYSDKMHEIPVLSNDRLDWVRSYYYRLDVQYEIIKQLKNRECALLLPSWETNVKSLKKSVRNLRVHSPQYLQRALKKLNFITVKETELFNLYGSVATYKEGIPFTVLYLADRDTKTWNRIHYTKMVAYDFFLDIDAGSHKDINHALRSCIMVCDFLTSLKCPYSVRFSGKGFHIIIPHKYFKFNKFDPHDENNIYKSYYIIAKYILDEFSEMVDLSIYDSRRVCKIAYSL
ncbi:unnamed protein product, partial [marine sediment metagenome]